MLTLGFLFAFFLTGFLFTEACFSYLEPYIKIPLYILLSVLLSTWTVYLTSLLFGFSQKSIFLSFFLFLPLIFLCPKPSFPKKHWPAFLSAFLIFLLFYLALYPAIFRFFKGYFVMAGPNWQDTAMHLGIIQSLVQGNFPPQAPYFAGHPLNYYYFANLHTAILAKLEKEFFPQILILTNPFFSSLFFLSLYAFAFYFTEKRTVSLLAAFLGTFNGSFIFVRFFQDIFSLEKKTLIEILKLLAGRGYTIEYGKFFQVSPMADYFLQNRPMMVGLPAFTLTILLIWKGVKEKCLSSLFLGGLITATLIKFQFFAFISLIISFFLAIFLSPKREKKFLFTFLFLPAIALLLFGLKSVNEQNLLEIAGENLSFGPWDKTKSFFWFLKFYLGNLGLPFLLAPLALFFNTPFLKRKDIKFLLTLTFLLFLIPNTVKFTIAKEDMFKFFYLLTIPSSLLAACFLEKIRKKAFFLFLLLLITSSLTSFLTLFWSLLNRNFAYCWEEYQAGRWIRENTPQNSVFIAYPSVHSPITQIGGRLRVLSYIVWPYTHGFNRGEDNVFKRLEDIKKVYQGKNVLEIMKKYNISYIFFGPKEREKIPEGEERLEKLPFLQKIYTNPKIQIYHLLL